MALINLKEILAYATSTASHHRHFTLTSLVFGSDDFLAAIGKEREINHHKNHHFVGMIVCMCMCVVRKKKEITIFL